MAISFDKALGIHAPALKLHAQRAEVLANNLANADTPGFKARDLDFKSILKNESQSNEQTLAMSTTNSQHLSFAAGDSGADLLYRSPIQPSIDGNTVEEQVEHAEYMKNSMQFEFSFTKMNGAFKGLTKAIKGD